MREIKFRAWDGEGMYYGGFGIHATGEILTPNTPVFSDPKEIKAVMQYTGLKDRKGEDIYEGDYVLFDLKSEWNLGDARGAEVRWCPELACFRYIRSVNGKPQDSGMYGLIDQGEIIGNIYANPELLREGTTANGE